jgi:hypothetical protein
MPALLDAVDGQPAWRPIPGCQRDGTLTMPIAVPAFAV